MYMNIYTYTQESSLVSSPRAHLSISSSIYLHLYLHLLSISLPISAYTCANMHARSKRTSGNHHAGGKCHVAAIDVMAAHCSHVVWVEKMRGKQRGEKQQQAEGRGKQRGAEGSRENRREAQGRTGKQREAQGGRRKQREAQRSRGKQREAQRSRLLLPSLFSIFHPSASFPFASLCFPLLRFVPPLLPSAPVCSPLLPWAPVC